MRVHRPGPSPREHLDALFRFRVRGGRINPLLNGRNDVLPFPRMFPPIYGQVTLHGAYHTVPRPGTPLDGTASVH